MTDMPLTSPATDESPATMPDKKKRFYLNALAVSLLVFSMAGLWRLVSNYDLMVDASGMNFYGSVGIAVLPLLFLTFVLMEESKLAVKITVGDDYKTRLDQLRNRLDYRENMIRLISNHQTGAIAIFDRHNRYFFANEVVAKEVGKTVMEIVGQPPIKVLSNEQAMKLELRLAEVRATEYPIEVVEPVVDKKGATRFLKRHYEMIADMPEMMGCVLLREEDLTDLIVERERREQMLRQVIETLVAVVDRRDPYATGHSSRVGQLARAIALEMGLEQLQVEASEIAGSLMNFGKVLVSRKILTKTSVLTPDELQRVRDSILISADILAIIGFEGPVVPTLRQVLERYDGTGVPNGLKGEEILVTARIVAVANAFVAFVSPRAHRDSLPFIEALTVLDKDAGKAYDERVLVAMRHYIENRPNKLDWLMASKPV
ncbi:MAG: HD domain-containing phosphohydrolase [Bdellovibrionales bacterium]